MNYICTSDGECIQSYWRLKWILILILRRGNGNFETEHWITEKIRSETLTCCSLWGGIACQARNWPYNQSSILLMSFQVLRPTNHHRWEQRLYPKAWWCLTIKLTTFLHLFLRLRTSGALPHIPLYTIETLYLCHRDNFTYSHMIVGILGSVCRFNIIVQAVYDDVTQGYKRSPMDWSAHSVHTDACNDNLH
jgi:hypothetical protein